MAHEDRRKKGKDWETKTTKRPFHFLFFLSSLLFPEFLTYPFAKTSMTRDKYLEALDEKRVHGRVQLLSRLGPEMYDYLLENSLHLRTLKHHDVFKSSNA